MSKILINEEDKAILHIEECVKKTRQLEALATWVKA